MDCIVKIYRRIKYYSPLIISQLLFPLIRIFPVRKKVFHDIIIIRTDGIGDFVMWAGTIDAIRECYAGKKLTYICPSNYLSLVKALGLFDDVIPVDKKKLETSPCYQMHFMLKMKSIRSEVVINPVRSRIYPSDFVVGAISANEKISVLKNVKDIYHRNHYYTRLLDIPLDLHEMSFTEVFTQQLIEKKYKHKIADFRNLSHTTEIVLHEPYCIIALSSTDERKIWETEKVCEVINNIPTKYSIILSGYGKADEQRAFYIKNNIQSEKNIIDYVGKTTMIELVQLVAGSSFVLGNDSSTVHIAAACRIPSICYMTGATYNSFLPYPASMADYQYHPRVVVKQMDCFGCWYHCNKPYGRTGPLFCLKEVTVPMVLFELNALLEEINKKR